MSYTNTNKLPVAKMLIGSILVAWWNKEIYSKALALPTLLLVITWATHTIFFEPIKGLSSWIILPFYLIGFSIFAVTCHRLVLADVTRDGFYISFKKREAKFALWVIAVYMIYSFALLIPMTLFLNLTTKSSTADSADILYFLASILPYIPAMYFLARFCMVLPSTAIDQKPNLNWSWELTRNNGWRIAIVVGLYPWLINTIIWLLSREDATIIEQTLTAFLYYAGMAVEIFALSLTFKELTKEPVETTL